MHYWVLSLLFAISSALSVLASNPEAKIEAVSGVLSASELEKKPSATPAPASESALVSEPPPIPIEDIYDTLNTSEAPLSPDVILTAANAVQCANHKNVPHNNILTVIDYALPSTQKRLWVFDLKQKKLLYHTHVTHGIRSGQHQSNFFSNVRNSRATSLGVFNTDFSYNGRYGLAVKLKGLERHFNDNAYDRTIVIHPAWYASEQFAQKYGRLGRSWGCPALPMNMIEPVINTIKDQTLLVVYYPSDKWLKQSTLLNCNGNDTLVKMIERMITLPKSPTVVERGPVLYVDHNNNKKRDAHDPVVVMSAENYQRIFDQRPPLTRMLRRQYQQTEYIVLTPAELRVLDSNADLVIDEHDQEGVKVLDLVVAKVKKLREFWATEFHREAKYGLPTSIRLMEPTPEITTAKTTSKLNTTDKFIRWLGL